MNPIRLIAREQPILLHHFFRSFVHRPGVRVFLCGSEEGERFHDLRHHVQALMKNDMRCEPFLGEHIPDLDIKARRGDYLSIEVLEAEKSAIVVVFLSSPGTISELTAFSLSSKINPKLIVFNSEQYRNKDSFINRGPLRLLGKEQIVYFSDDNDFEQKRFYRNIVAHLDFRVASARYDEFSPQKPLEASYNIVLQFLDFLLLCLVYSTFPIQSAALHRLVPAMQAQKKKVSTALKKLLALNLIIWDDGEYVPAIPLSSIPYE